MRLVNQLLNDKYTNVKISQNLDVFDLVSLDFVQLLPNTFVPFKIKTLCLILLCSTHEYNSINKYLAPTI